MVWGFGQITNQSSQILMFDYAVGAGGTGNGSQLNVTRGNATLQVGSLGALYFTDVGHKAGGPHYWAVDIQVGNLPMRWWYDGVGALDVEVNADGSFRLSGQGQFIFGHFVTKDTPSGPVGTGIKVAAPV